MAVTVRGFRLVTVWGDCHRTAPAIRARILARRIAGRGMAAADYALAMPAGGQFFHFSLLLVTVVSTVCTAVVHYCLALISLALYRHLNVTLAHLAAVVTGAAALTRQRQRFVAIAAWLLLALAKVVESALLLTLTLAAAAGALARCHAIDFWLSRQ